MELDLPIALQILGFLAVVFGLWYKINQDIQIKADETRRISADAISKLESKVEQMRANSITRQEHENDIQSVKAEIRSFRDEVRDDIRLLNTNLSSRFDILLTRMLEPRQINRSSHE